MRKNRLTDSEEDAENLSDNVNKIGFLNWTIQADIIRVLRSLPVQMFAINASQNIQ